MFRLDSGFVQVIEFPSTQSTGEIYDPATGEWWPVIDSGQGIRVGVGREAESKSQYDLTTLYNGFSATSLREGGVLVAGGWGRVGDDVEPRSGAAIVEVEAGSSSPEIPRPLWLADWSPAGLLQMPRVGHAATLLEDARVLVTGGKTKNGAAEEVTTSSCEVYDPFTNAWTATAPMNEPRSGHEAVRLTDGSVLVVGGTGGDGSQLTSAEVYDPERRQWSFVGPMSTPRSGMTISRLQDGRIMAAGGGLSSAQFGSVEIYDPAKRSWSRTGNLGKGIRKHVAVELDDGRVLVAGGETIEVTDDRQDVYLRVLSSVEVWDPISGAWSGVGNMLVPRMQMTGILLLDGRVLFAGGQDEFGQVASTELFVLQAE